MIVFFKATIPGGAAASLFDTPIMERGHITKDGTFVAPHASHRKKRAPERAMTHEAPPDLFAPRPKAKGAEAQPDLFAAPAAPAAAPAVPAAPDSKVAPTPATEPSDTEYTAFVLTPESRESLLEQFPPAYPRVVAHHVTHEFPAAPGAEPKPAEIAVIGQVDDGKGVQALVVSVDGQVKRPGREAYHITWSLDEGRSAVESNAVVAAGWTPVAPAVPVATKPARLSKSPKAPKARAERKKLEPRAVEPAAVEPVIAPVAPVAAWGVEPGTTKATRKKLNAEARAILAAKTDAEMTDADRAALARYTGTGTIGDSANEFYTPPAVAEAMWTLMQRAGFSGGDVLEPSCGTGVFLHTAPPAAHVVGVEFDATSARIAGALHRPAGHEVVHSPAESFATTDGRTFAAVIGNPPFGVRGATIRDDKRDISKAEQYFVDMAMDKAADGAPVCLVLPTGVMDSANGRWLRDAMLRKGEFLGAWRLPNTAFEAAHTQVTTDVVLFRKRPQEAAGALGTLNDGQFADLGLADEEFASGQYFAGRGAGHVFGTLEPGWRAKAGMGDDITVSGDMHGVPAALAGATLESPPATPDMHTILAALHDERDKRRAVSAALKPPYRVAVLGDVQVINGIRYVLQGEPPRWRRADGEVSAAVEDAVELGRMLDDLASGRAVSPDDLRSELATALDAYVAEHGAPHRNKDMHNWLRSPSLPNDDERAPEDHAAHVQATRRRVALALGAVADDGTYSDLVTGRKREVDHGVVDMQAEKLALELGGFSAGDLAAAADRSADEVVHHLWGSPDFALLPDGTWTTKATYLAGELWAKYDEARAAAADESRPANVRERFARQADQLEAEIAPQSLEDVEIALNSGFVTPDMLTGWFAWRTEQYKLANPNSQWTPTAPVFSFDGTMWSATGTSTFGDHKMLLDNLNRDGVKKDDQDKVKAMTAEFREWLLSSEFREGAETAYNRTYRGFRPMIHSDSPIAIPGMVMDPTPDHSVKSYQYSGLRWALAAKKGIIAADVGLGKTLRGLMLAKLAKSSGQCKKPTIVVPKSVLFNWAREAEMWFPGARVLVIGETMTTDRKGNAVSKPDDAETRRRKYAEMQQNDYDFVLISAPAWNELDLNPIKKGEYADSDFWTRRGDALGNSGSKRLNQMREKHEQALAQKDFKRDGTVYFDDLGVDMLILDEGHQFKNLFSARQRFGQNPKFLGGSGESARAQDTAFKTRFVRESNGGNGVYMLTATPTKNSPLEVYSMLAHIAPEAFERMGIRNSEDFLDRFCEFENDQILGLDGAFEESLVTAGFKNLGELREVMKRYIDRTTADQVGLKLPDRDDRTHMVDMTPEQERIYAGLREDAKHSKDPDGPHIFSTMSQMEKCGMSLDLLGIKGSVSPKALACADAVQEHSSDGGQVVFCDHIAMHDEMKRLLVERGFAPNQIGIINAQVASSVAARQKIADDFNAGKVRVVIGNTACMGEGMNLQKQTSDIHHLDLPWEPASLQQRNGRGLRQGNKKSGIRIHSYLAKGSFDGYRWQTIRSKKDWQDTLWNGADRAENLARSGQPSAAEMLIMLSANPEEAKAAFDANKAAAAERVRVQRTGEAMDNFAKYQEARENITKMRDVGWGGSATERLEQRAHKLRERLEADTHFGRKDLLDIPTPVLIEPTTGNAWHEGAGLDLAPGYNGPLNWSRTEKSRWVVSGIDRAAKKVTLRRYGVLSDSPVTVDLSALAAGCAPAPCDAEEEAAEIERAEASAVAMAKTEAEKRALDHPTYHAIKALPAAMRDRLAPVLRAGMKRALLGYGATTAKHVGFIGPDGEMAITSDHGARRLATSHDPLLPIAADRERALDAWVAAENARGTSANWVAGHRGGEIKGVKATYALQNDYGVNDIATNPWSDVIRDFWPDAKFPRERVAKVALERIAAAPTFHEAFQAATPALNLDAGYGRHSWPEDIAMALHRKATDLGVLDRKMAGVAPESSRSMPTGVEPELLKVPGRKVKTGRRDPRTLREETYRPEIGREHTVSQWLGNLLDAEPESAT